MKTRPLAAGFFVACCLLLCGLILRGQIAAHPPPRLSPQQDYGGQSYGPDHDWHPAAPATAAQVRFAARSEVTALHDGNLSKATLFLSRFVRLRFSDPAEFLGMVMERHPEIASYKTLRLGPVWIDPAEENARATLFFEGKDGTHDRDDFLLDREGGRFKVIHFRAQPPN